MIKKTFTIIYSIFVSLVLLFSITFFAVNIYNEKNHGELRTQARFGKVSSGVSTILKKDSKITNETMRQIENSIGDTKDFAFLSIKVDSKTIYIFPSDYNPEQSGSSDLILPYDYKVKASDGREIQITAGMYSLRPVSIFSYAKTSFFIILIVTLLTIILIIYNNHFDSDINTKKSRKIVNEEIYDDEIEEELEKEDDVEDTQDDEEEVTEEETNNENLPIENVSESKEPEEVKVEIKEEPASHAPGPKPVELPVKEYEPVEILEDATEKGLFSPDTGFGWESYLLTRLDNELNRATASELDLALFVIKLDGIGRKNPIMKKVCEYLTLEFQFKDLLFEYKDDSICALKISMNIDSAITFAEKLTEELKNITAEEAPTVLIGVTTRGIRMVTGERLLREADEAVKHAAEDANTSVVGFRADAVKYRKFIGTN